MCAALSGACQVAVRNYFEQHMILYTLMLLLLQTAWWCEQHDEAAAHYVAMIDQTTRGHQFLQDVFNYTPTVGWQARCLDIDLFTHDHDKCFALLPLLASVTWTA